MKSKIVLYVIGVFLIASIGVFIGYKMYHQNVKPVPENDYYKIVYDDNTIPGNTYTIMIDKDINVNIKHQPQCSTVECVNGSYYPEAKTYDVKLNDENKIKLKEYLEKVFKDNPTKELEIIKDKEDQTSQVIQSLVSNNEYYLDLALEDYEYYIEYSYGYETYYNIFLKNNNVTVKKLTYNHLGKISDYKTYKINFSQENMSKLISVLKEQFKDTENKHLIIKRPYGNTLVVLQSIVKNKENELKNLKNNKLLFSLEDGVCSIAYIFDDNTYTLYNTTGRAYNDFTNDTYEADVQKFITNISSYTTTKSYITININNSKYSLDSENPEVQELINSIPGFNTCVAVD